MTALHLQLQSGFPVHATDIHHSKALNARLAQVLDVREHENNTRGEIESFIRQCFSATHGASISNFMPRLLSLSSKGGDVIAAFGLRAAANSSLFLETYLDQPIEAILHSRVGEIVHREKIIEVGNLSALYPGAARWLIVALTVKLHDEGYKWVTFTGTSAVRNVFSRLGLRPVDLGMATLEHLPISDRANWGSYYDNAPIVMAGDIDYGYRSLLQDRDLTELLRAGMDSVDAII